MKGTIDYDKAAFDTIDTTAASAAAGARSVGLMTFADLQAEVGEWGRHNFGREAARWHQILGIVEEVGELSHSFLKRDQGIRGTAEEHREKIKDALADIIIYVAHFCEREGLDLQEIVEQTWSRVSARDWKKNPLHGGDVASHTELEAKK